MTAQANPTTVPLRPEDALPDQIDRAEINGVTVRKGTVAAFLRTRCGGAILLLPKPIVTHWRTRSLGQSQRFGRSAFLTCSRHATSAFAL